MHPSHRPVALMVALWATREFEFPADAAALAEPLREKFPLFNELRLVQSDGPLHPELPRAVLLAEGGRWALELAPSKILLRRMGDGVPALAELFGQVQAQLSPLQSWLAESHNLRVCRLGALTQLFCDTRSSANDKIVSYFLQPRALQGQAPLEVQLGLLTRLALADGWIVNRWLRVQPLRTADPSHVDLAARIEIDLNTLAEDTHLRTGRDIVNFLEAARQHVENLPLLNDPDFFA